MSLKIVNWNCHGALRNKLDRVNQLQADVLIVQECEDPAQSSEVYREWAGDYLWVGDSLHKGIGIFPKNGNLIKPLDWKGQFIVTGFANHSSAMQWSTDSLKLFLPFLLNDTYLILAVWTKGKDDLVFGYIGQLWKYLQIHGQDLQRPNSIIIGDFNSNACWDKPDRWWNHSDVVDLLDDMGFVSLYHQKTGEAQGQESQATFFMQRKLEKPYHIDYAFVSNDLSASTTLALGAAETWLKVSDHVPLILTLNEQV